MTADEGAGWQRLDKWLWCARFLKHRADCARLVRGGLFRINRQPTDKPHARLRPDDVLTLPLRDDVVVVRVLALATRRGPASEARTLYAPMDDIEPPPPPDPISRQPVLHEPVLHKAVLHEAENDCISPSPQDAAVTRSTG